MRHPAARRIDCHAVQAVDFAGIQLLAAFRLTVAGSGLRLAGASDEFRTQVRRFGADEILRFEAS